MTNLDSVDKFQAFADKMRAEAMPDIAIANFRDHYRQLLQGHTGFILEADIQPVHDLPGADELGHEHKMTGEKALPHSVLIKLNGGLGTSMGLEKAKSLIRVKDQYCFLDVIALHAIHSGVPLVLMNSFNTRADSLEVLEKYSSLNEAHIGLDFVQHKVPKINQHDLAPAVCDTQRQLEWCPPGHGDIYAALASSDMLATLLDADYRYALVSNADNLGAVLDSRLLGFMVQQGLPFLMEVTDRTEADKKGGHLARLADGRLVLRESAQCVEEDRDAFENITRHRYFNTNNLWIDLQLLQDTLNKNNNVLGLPLIRNAKMLDPRDSASCPVYQLESAMGSAISVFDGAQAIRVPRSRFAPVKTTADLLLVRSDVYELGENYALASRLEQGDLPLIHLDQDFYRFIDAFESRFPCGAPSLLAARELSIEGDISFAENISVRGRVKLINTSNSPVSLPANTEIGKDIIWD